MENINMRRILAALFGVLLCLGGAASVEAQTALSTTTLGAAVADGAVTSVTVAATTGITAPGTGSTQVFLVIDREIMAVRTVNTTTLVVGVQRGANGSRATPHISGAAVTVAPAIAIFPYIPAGQCTRTNQTYVPYVVGGGTGLGAEVGTMYDCLGVTTAGQWVQTNGYGAAIKGSDVATATTIAPTGTYFKVTGTTAIATITVPAGTAAGFCLVIEATGVATWTAGGNILTAGTYTAAGHFVTFCWNGAKWVPDKVA